MAANSSPKTAPQWTLTTISTRSPTQPQSGELRVRSFVLRVFTKAKNREHLESSRIGEFQDWWLCSHQLWQRSDSQTDHKTTNLLPLQLVVWFSPKPGWLDLSYHSITSQKYFWCFQCLMHEVHFTLVPRVFRFMSLLSRGHTLRLSPKIQALTIIPASISCCWKKKS